jgi:hypothetical protein
MREYLPECHDGVAAKDGAGQARNHESCLPDRVVAGVDCRGIVVKRVEMSRGAISLGDGRLCGTSSRMSDTITAEVDVAAEYMRRRL